MQLSSFSQLAFITLRNIWPNINIEEAHYHLKLLTTFDPLTTDASIRDFWAWFSIVKLALC